MCFLRESQNLRYCPVTLSMMILPKPILFSSAALGLLCSCGRIEERMTITETRTVSTRAAAPQVGIPSKVRFYDDKQEQEAGPREHPLLWTTPAGWTEGDPNQMRLIDLKFGPSQEGECYLSALPGPAGGLDANINRWRSQLGLAPLTAADIEKLPRKPFLGGQAHSITADGEYKNMGQEVAQKDYRLVGLIQQAPELTLFVKMTGPKALVESQMANFESFVTSLQFRKRASAEP